MRILLAALLAFASWPAQAAGILGAGLSVQKHSGAPVITNSVNCSGSTGLMRFDGTTFVVDCSNDEVGIGTTNPGEKLELNGGHFNLLYGDNNAKMRIGDSASTGDFALIQWNSTADDLRLGTDTGGHQLFLKETGDTGIGVSSPDGKVEIRSGATTTGFVLNVSSQNAANMLIVNGNGNVGVNAIPGASFRLDVKATTDDSSASIFRARNASDATMFGIRNDGFASFGGNLSLMAAGTQIFTDTADGSDSDYVQIGAGGAVGNDRGGYINMGGNEATGVSLGGKVQIIAGNVATGTIDFVEGGATKMRVNRGGNVGVGTDEPATKLHMSSGTLLVDGSGAALSVLGLITANATVSDTNGSSGLIFPGSFGGVQTDTGNDFRIWGYDGTNFNTNFFIDRETRRTAINNTAPTATLHVTSNTAVNKFVSYSLGDDESVALETNLGASGILTLVGSGNSGFCIYAIRGAENTSSELADGGGKCVNTDTDGSIAIFPDGDSTYTLRNRTGSAIIISAQWVGF